MWLLLILLLSAILVVMDGLSHYVAANIYERNAQNFRLAKPTLDWEAEHAKSRSERAKGIRSVAVLALHAAAIVLCFCLSKERKG